MPTSADPSTADNTTADNTTNGSTADGSTADAPDAPPEASQEASQEASHDDSGTDDTRHDGKTGEPLTALTYRPIHAWDPDDQPREKLIQRGPAVLSDGELLALLMGSGTRTSNGPVSAVELGRAVIDAFGGSLRDVSQRPLKELTRVPGVGPAKAAKMMAGFELGRRTASQEAGERVQVTSPEDVAAVYIPLMRDLKKEIFKVVHLNTANVIQNDYTVSEGGLAASIVEPRAVFEKAILDNAASLICLHNHPSGNLEPSREDIRITRQLVEAGRTMGIPVQDHLIIAGTGYTSLATRGIIDG
jgi:DNA repair protein RadC